MEFWKQLFGSGDFMPHGYCYLWNHGLVWLHLISDSLVALSYLAISIVLLVFARKRRDVPFSWMFVLFGVFIVACGGTHAMEVWNLWHANYWLAGILKGITAAASIPTAILAARRMPELLHLPSVGQWIQANAQLQREVRERRELELNLRISEANYREQAELLDLTHDAVFVRDAEGKIVYWNRGAERLYGWVKEEVRRKVSHELLRTKFPVPRSEIEAEVYEKGFWEGELIHHRRDGVPIIVSSRWALQSDASGGRGRILEVNRDITQRKIQENRFRTLLESAPDAMIIANERGEIRLINAQAERLFGYSRQELIGRMVEALVPRRFQERHVVHRNLFSQNRKARSMGVGLELYGMRKDGTEFPVEVSLSPIETNEGSLVVSAIRDVTERRLSEEHIRGLNLELSKRVGELASINKELESFSYSVSHDLRAPLRHIDGFARILREECAANISDDGRQHLDRILNAATHMGHLIDDLLDLARIGRKELIRQRVDMNAVVRQVVANFSSESHERKIEWKIDPLPEADCDAGLMKVVLTNLFSNAVKFTTNQPVSTIHVGSLEKEGRPVYFVSDNGVGFDPKYADKLFGVFQRLHRQEEFEGTGIGLATVQRIVHRHGGDIWAESSPGRGATFFFTLRQTKAEKQQSSEEAKLGIT